MQQWFEQLGDRSADVEIALQASNRLNLDTKGKPLSVVVRVFKLKDRAEFDRSSYETLTSDQPDKPGLAGDLLGTQELLLLPNSIQRYRESLDDDVQYIGLVAAFRKPSPTGWRLAFPVKELVQRNVIVNLGPCFLTLTTMPAKTSQCADIRRKPAGKTTIKPAKKNVQTT